MSGAANRRGRGRRRGGSGGHGEEHDGGSHERWLVTYADMLTLLLVLFIVLYAMSVVDTTKFVQLRAGLAAVFNPGSSAIANDNGAITSTEQGGSQSQELVDPQVMPTSSKTILTQQQAVQDAKTAAQQQNQRVETEVDQFKQIQAAIQKALDQQGMSGAALFSIDQRGLVVTIVTNGVVFAGNSADLLDGGKKIINVVTPPLLKFSNNIEVDGNTNQEKVSTAPFPNGWSLSSERASSVVQYMIDSFDFPQNRLSAVGFADTRPLVPLTNPNWRVLNRRVDVVVLSNLSAADRALLPTVGAEPVK